MRVLTLRAVPVRFVVDLGQRNAVFRKRPLVPHRRLFTWGECFAPAPERSYDLVHSNNAVPVMTRRPYVISFESFLPRLPDNAHHGVLERPVRAFGRHLRDRLLEPQCVALLAWSQYAVRQHRFQQRGWAHLDELGRKMRVFHPRVALGRDTPKVGSGRLRLLMVGGDYMRKGGPALVRAHARLRQTGLPVETTVVSGLQWTPDDYVGPSSHDYVEREHDRVKSEPGVRYNPSLPYADVLRLMEEADFFVLPTLHDTFGFVSIEALAQGTPVIASATCAQPEIVEHGRNGFLLPFENDSDVGKWPWISRRHDPAYLEAYDDTIERLAASLGDELERFWDERDGYERLSQGAIDRVRDRFDVAAGREELEALYERCRA
ncbi:MAG: glycosyltransferase family 4 protein [Gaiellaceae bacterium]